MKPISLFILLAFTALTSCRKFLDEPQDNRASIDSEDKVSKLLVYAYVDAQYAPFAETMSDNADDKGSKGVEGTDGQINMDAYMWKDYESLTIEDTPVNFWMKSYAAIAQANQALESLEKLATKTEHSSSLRGEALLARAYAHFMLVNLFALRYDPATASTALGIPYVLSPEKNAVVEYHRETMAETYRLIEKDLTEGLPLVRNDYKEPKFHFTPQAANAFAARFYLYKGEWDKVIKHASSVVGDAPASVIRDYVSSSYTNLSYTGRAVQYSSSTERANLLIGWTSSLIGRYYPEYRYGLSAWKASVLFHYTTNPFKKSWAYSIFGEDIFYNMPKYEEYFRYTNASAGIGYPFASLIHFTTDEALLNRAEAYAMSNKFEEASHDLTTFLSVKTKDFDEAEDKVTLELMIKVYPKVNREYTPPYALSSDQSSFVKGIAELRRREFCHEGLRWFDVKRFNLPVRHWLAGGGNLDLPKDDPRRAIQIPETAKAFGIEANMR